MSSGSVVARSIVRDVYANEQAARVLATLTIIFCIVPIAAPLGGAFLAVSAGWRAVFACLAVAALVLLAAVALGLRETAPAERRSAHPAQILATFASILREPRFLMPYLLVLSAHVGVLAWVASSSFALVVGLGVPTGAYGWMCALVMLGQICGAWASSRLVLGHGIGRLLRLGAGLMLAAGAAAAALAWSGVSHWSAVVLPFTVFLFGTALIVPNATAMALGPFPRAAGSASSVIGATGYSAGALLSAALGAAFDGTARPMASVAALAGASAFLLERYLVRGKT